MIQNNGNLNLNNGNQLDSEMIIENAPKHYVNENINLIESKLRNIFHKRKFLFYQSLKNKEVANLYSENIKVNKCPKKWAPRFFYHDDNMIKEMKLNLCKERLTFEINQLMHISDVQLTKIKEMDEESIIMINSLNDDHQKIKMKKDLEDAIKFHENLSKDNWEKQSLFFKNDRHYVNLLNNTNRNDSDNFLLQYKSHISTKPNIVNQKNDFQKFNNKPVFEYNAFNTPYNRNYNYNYDSFKNKPGRLIQNNYNPRNYYDKTYRNNSYPHSENIFNKNSNANFENNQN